MRLTPFGHCVQVTFFPDVFPVNCYLVQESDGLTLVDTGMSTSARPLQRAAESLGLPIQRIVLTHAHGDHTGSVDILHQAWPAAEVMISARDARLLRGDTRLDSAEPQTKIKGNIHTVRATPTGFL
ncbi:MBL fold metallo-hydrolase, partial [Alicyclobacillaceae bacterium I2511]